MITAPPTQSAMESPEHPPDCFPLACNHTKKKKKTSEQYIASPQSQKKRNKTYPSLYTSPLSASARIVLRVRRRRPTPPGTLPTPQNPRRLLLLLLLPPQDLLPALPHRPSHARLLVLPEGPRIGLGVRVAFGRRRRRRQLTGKVRLRATSRSAVGAVGDVVVGPRGGGRGEG